MNGGKSLSALRRRKSRLIIGLMSGTSLDGVDAALCEITGSSAGVRVRLRAFSSYPYPEALRKKLLSLASGEKAAARDWALINARLGRCYAECCLQLCEEAKIPPDRIDLAGCHGQTLWHEPLAVPYLGEETAGTLQAGDASYLCEALGCPVISDFRTRDIAAGGQGAPLVPYTEYLLYRSEDQAVGLQNIGGIGNLTVLPAACPPEAVIAFDTGPGNMVMDALADWMTQGQWTYDHDGTLASQGTVNEALLARMLGDPYLAKAPPKTTGRERYGPSYLQWLLETAEGLPPADIMATAACFTAECIRIAALEISPVRPDRLIVGGGGAENPVLMRMIAAALPQIPVLRQEDLGLSSQAKEAVAFALLANEFLFGHPGNLPGATGAKHPVVLGKLSL